MAIQQFGESLLSDIRSRRAKEEKRLRKEEEKQAILGLGVGLLGKIGNEVLADKTSSFLQNEQIFAARAQQKAAAQNAANIFATEKAVQASGMSYEDYFSKAMRPEFEARAKTELDMDVTGPAGAYESLVSKKVRELAEQQAEAHRTALELANKVSSTEDFDATVAINAKKARPSSVGSLITGGIKNFFTGRSREDIEEEALLAITEGPMSDNAEKLNVFMKEYNRTKDLVGSFDFANFVVPEPTSEDRLFKIDEEVTFKEIGDVVYEITTTKKTNRNTGEIISKENIKEVDSSEEGFTGASAKAFSTIFNYGKDGRDELTTDAFANFAREAKELGIRPEAPLSLEEFTALGKIYSKYTDDPQNLRDQFRQDQILNIQEVLISDAEQIKSLVAGLEEDPAKRNQLIQVLRYRLAELMRLSESMVTGRTNYVEVQ